MKTKEIDAVQLNVEVKDWREAVEKAGKLLLEKGYIDSKYIHESISSIETFGPYVVIEPQLAIVHSTPGSYVNKTSFSLITLKDEVRFGHEDNDPVKIVIMFASENNENHLGIIKKIVNVFSVKENKEKIISSMEEDSVLKLFEEDYL